MRDFADFNTALNAVFDPGTGAADLDAIAHEQPDLRHLVAGHGNVASGTLDWLATQGDQNVDQVLAGRGWVPPSDVVPEPGRGRSRRALWGWLAAIAAVVAILVTVVAVMARPPETTETRIMNPLRRAPVQAQDLPAPVQLWAHDYGGEGDDVFQAVAVAPTEAIVVVGYTTSLGGDFPSGNHDQDAVVAMLNRDGVMQWSQTYGGADDDVFRSVAVSQDGSIYAVGQSGASAVAVKLSADGKVLWTKLFSGNGDEYFAAVAVTASGIVVAGYTDATTGDFTTRHGGRDALLVGIDETGTVLWQGAYGGLGDDSFAGLAVRPDGSLVAVGKSDSADGDFGSDQRGPNAVLAQFDASGGLQWANTYGGSGDDEFNDVAVMASDSFFVVGGTASTDGQLRYAMTSGVMVGIDCALTARTSVPNCGSLGDATGDVTMLSAAVAPDGSMAYVSGMPGDPWQTSVSIDSVDQGTALSSTVIVDEAQLNGVAALPDGRFVVVGAARPGSVTMPATHGATDAIVALYVLI